MCYVLASASLKLAVPGCWVALHCMRASRFESLRRYVGASYCCVPHAACAVCSQVPSNRKAGRSAASAVAASGTTTKTFRARRRVILRGLIDRFLHSGRSPGGLCRCTGKSCPANTQRFVGGASRGNKTVCPCTEGPSSLDCSQCSNTTAQNAENRGISVEDCECVPAPYCERRVYNPRYNRRVGDSLSLVCPKRSPNAQHGLAWHTRCQIGYYNHENVRVRPACACGFVHAAAAGPAQPCVCAPHRARHARPARRTPSAEAASLRRTPEAKPHCPRCQPWVPLYPWS
jgi:hypothetical protein